MVRHISAILSIKDKNFSAKLKEASKGTNSFDKRLKQSRNQITRYRDTAKSSFKSIATSVAGLATAYIGISKAVTFAQDSVALAKDQIEAETKLAAVMKNTKGVTDKQIQSVKDYASVQQNLGVIGDEVQLSGVQQLATYQLQSSTLKKLMPGMNDLLSQQKGLNATQQDAANIGNMFGKVMNGQVGALSRAGINFTKAQEKVLKYGTEQEKAATLAEVLQMNVGGVNKALAETDQGKIQQATNAFGDMKEEIGKKIIPLQAKFAGWFFEKLPTIQTAVLGFIDKGVAAFNTAKPVVSGLFEALKPGITWAKDVGIPAVVSAFTEIGNQAQPIFTWIGDTGLPKMKDGLKTIYDKSSDIYNFISTNWNTFEPLILGIAGAITTYKIGVVAISTVQKIWTGVTTALTIAQGLLNGTLALSPLGWVALAIGAVIAAGVLLYRNWDTVKESATNLWISLKTTWSKLQDSTEQTWYNIKNSAVNSINKIIEKINGMIEIINKIPGVNVPIVPKIARPQMPSSMITNNYQRVGGEQMPQFALGTSYFGGGTAMINERGGEIVDLPNGTRVYPHDKSVQMARSEGGGNYFDIKIYAAGKSVDEMANEFVSKIKLQLANV